MLRSKHVALSNDKYDFYKKNTDVLIGLFIIILKYYLGAEYIKNKGKYNVKFYTRLFVIWCYNGAESKALLPKFNYLMT
jgi:hypothetical protein